MSPADETTRTRILEAALAEFARHGIAGARINRIAAAARTSKERLYAYFRDKEELLETIKAQQMAEIARAVPMDPDDLPGYVGRLFDHFRRHPEHHRIAAWCALEDAGQALPEDHPRLAAYRAKLEKLRAAQRAGLIDPGWDPVALLGLLIALARSWCHMPQEVCQLAGAAEPTLARHRAAVVEAARRLLRPPG
ncbi:TetR family transcriptional regulator [Pseudoroseomonas rhizosphaerae]|uniref:TetR family transcriptional regulator n=1 Tax=Teichococcus rhizosphaerae TaxID=1335062 RepID=A0A2C7A5V7_9PROT|nr:TetR family transcriptional regulator [Pseudoroseomonas rhizosphaerae]PHK95478.1 TetR family transcriptional regulator [Pseudoroseomonas rhizosphaerae]